ncbi:MAG: hypothetical protein PG978_000718 [Wolbachia endosymbiont of Ctenocephalides felis wCfeF]|nr:MAG: hypothetical protein PG978_000718 [Wolbachia endosymbiont of Ctenocephalides felis wCfeF]
MLKLLIPSFTGNGTNEKGLFLPIIGKLSKFITCPICLPNNECWYKNYEKMISIAAGNCDLEIVKFLIERNLLDIHSTRGFGGWLLGYATEKECLKVVQFLAEQKVDINSTSGNLSNITALHYAAEQGNLEIVKVLLQNGANPNVEEFRGRKPRELAAIQYSENSNKPYKEIISLLYEAERTYISEK